MRDYRWKYVKFKDFLEVIRLFLVLPIAYMARIFIRHLWLICEDANEARDNGYWLFKWIRENHPEQKIAYVINKRAKDFLKVKELGKVIQYGGWKHWFWYLVAEKNISSQKGGKPNAAVCYFFEIKFHLLPAKHYFLQHGIIPNNTEWLYYDVCRFKMFACGAKPEYEYVKKYFGYPDNVVKYLGLCRFDNLHNVNADPNLILVMPTWREWISRPTKESNYIDDMSSFVKSEYFIKWNEFINSRTLRNILQINHKKLIFYPHRNMQKYIDYFNSPDERIIIADRDHYDVQELLKNASLLVTDYSSVFFDFAYMKKPIIFYQFDEEKFHRYQYKAGYFDYRDNVLGKWTNELDSCLELIAQEAMSNFPKNTQSGDFFELYDMLNCERNYFAILEG